MDLVVLVIEAEDNVAEAKVFYGMSRNIKFQVLDLEVDLGEGLGDTKEDGEEWLEGGSHMEDCNPWQFLYSLSTAKALLKFDFDYQVDSASK